MFKKLFVGAVAVAFAANVASAQAPESAKPITFGVAAGASIPVSDLGDFYKLGWNAALSTTLKTPFFSAAPLSIRLEAAYHSLSEDVAVDNLQIFAGTVNGVIGIPMAESPVKPYVIAGVGAYISDAGGATAKSTDFGYNGGFGVSMEMAGFNTFIEARYHTIDVSGAGSNSSFIPITVGINF